MPKEDLTPDQSSRQFASIQEKNLQHLIKVLGTKQSIDALTAIGTTDKETWKNINDTVLGLNEFVVAGGISSMGEQLTDVVTLQLEALLAPLKNELSQLIVSALSPFLDDISTLINDLSHLMTSNEEGTLIGGIAGMIVGLFVGGGPLVGILGAIIGAALQDFFQDIMGSLGTIEPREDPNSPLAMSRFYEEFGYLPSGPYDKVYLDWFLRTYYGEYF